MWEMVYLYFNHNETATLNSQTNSFSCISIITWSYNLSFGVGHCLEPRLIIADIAHTTVLANGLLCFMVFRVSTMGNVGLWLDLSNGIDLYDSFRCTLSLKRTGCTTSRFHNKLSITLYGITLNVARSHVRHWFSNCWDVSFPIGSPFVPAIGRDYDHAYYHQYCKNCHGQDDKKTSIGIRSTWK